MAPIILGTITAGRNVSITDGDMVIVNIDVPTDDTTGTSADDVNIAAESVEITVTSDNDLLADLLGI